MATSKPRRRWSTTTPARPMRRSSSTQRSWQAWFVTATRWSSVSASCPAPSSRRCRTIAACGSGPAWSPMPCRSWSMPAPSRPVARLMPVLRSAMPPTTRGWTATTATTSARCRRPTTCAGSPRSTTSARSIRLSKSTCSDRSTPTASTASCWPASEACPPSWPVHSWPTAAARSWRCRRRPTTAAIPASCRASTTGWWRCRAIPLTTWSPNTASPNCVAAICGVAPRR